ncbi:MAG: beta-propeller domain-containing protein [Verrucomicrobiales bacterium]|nr:beta-propeller domain-containing protein [Verrucomicrobiales bacterium]
MKRNRCCNWFWLVTLTSVLLATPLGGRTAKADPAPEARPHITSIQFDTHDVIVTVQVPDGLRKVTLESRPRLGAGNWTPRAVQRLDGQGGELVFRLAHSAALELLRVRGDAEEPLPAAYYSGPTTFNGQTSEGTAGQSPFTTWRMLDANGPAAPEAGGGGTASREVVESDIWVIRGQTLYFFNQYRGLQIIDLTTSDHPVVTGTFPLPAAGEQMYVLGDRYLVLLARAGCTWGPDQGSQVLLLEVVAGQPRLLRSLPVPGHIQESRLVGSALYVASQTYRAVSLPPQPDDGRGTASESWEYGSQVSSFDLSDPAAPVARSTFWYPGYGHVVAATDRFLFVGLQVPNNWWQTEIRLLDIASPDGTMVPTATVRPAGRVADKFKLNLNGEVFTVISHVWRWGGRDETVSVLETFSLADAAQPRRLGEIRVGRGEALFATRFDGDRAYLVTFERVDPLWIVDLRDPANPRLLGELEVPGWSTYIQPLGDRLVTVGIASETNWQVAVSLFDVRDPAQPALLAKVPLGEDHSWSEANYDEKAFTVLPDAGLILVPYQGYTQQGYASRVQLIELTSDTLTARGVIEHALQPRRATLHGERILSLSGRELLVVDATDRDHPEVTHTTELAWPVDRLFALDDHLVEIERGLSWANEPSPTVRVVATADPETILSRLALPRPENVVGATRSGRHLYVLQSQATSWFFAVPEGGQDPDQPPVPVPNLFLTVLDLAALPALSLVGTAEVALENSGWLSDLQAFTPRPGVLVWAGGASGWWRGPWLGGVALDARGLWPWWGGGAGGQFFAFDIRDPAAPRFASLTRLAEDADAWGFSTVHQAGELLFVSHQRSDFIESWHPPGASPDQIRGQWVSRHYLSVLDFTDPFVPTVRPPVNLPGQLAALSHGGAVLYTTGPHWDRQGQTDWTPFLDVLAYDGVEASLITSQKLGSDGAAQSVAINDHLVLARYESSRQTTVLETWRLTDPGVLTQVGLAQQPGYPNGLLHAAPLLLLNTAQEVSVYDATDPARLIRQATAVPDGCLYPDLSAGVAIDGPHIFLPLGDYGVLRIDWH